MGQVLARLRNKPHDAKQAIQQLHGVEELYIKRIQYLELQYKRKRQEALQQHQQRNPVLAMVRLRESKRLMQTAHKLVPQLDLVEQLRTTLEQLTFTLSTTEVIRDATRTMRVLNEQAVRVDALLEETREQVHLSRDLVDRLEQAGEELAAPVDYSEAELERELAALVEFPALPRQEPIQRPPAEEEDDDFQRLTASMA
jgi:hypothetical protein